MTKVAAYARMAFVSSLALLTVEARAQIEGTLFTKPEEREYLDYLRLETLRNSGETDFNIADVVIPEIPDEAAAAEATGPVEYSFGGVMARRDGIRIWLNGNLLAESELPEGFSVVETDRSFSLHIVQSGKTFVLLPGQIVDVTAGTVIESSQRPPTIEPEASSAITAPVQEVATVNAVTEEANTGQAAQAVSDSNAEAASLGEVNDFAGAVAEMSEEDAALLSAALERRRAATATQDTPEAAKDDAP